VRIQFIGNVATATCKIDNLKLGRYAAYIIHDRNQNGKMDSNLVGFPLEAFGFSNVSARPDHTPPGAAIQALPISTSESFALGSGLCRHLAQA
jgi:uncharacterized protein (DUF2141 family)